MSERNWLWAAVIIGGIILGLVWNKKDNLASPGGWVPGQQQQQLQQHPANSWEAKLKEAKETGKQLFVYFGRSDCQPCQRMKSEVLPNAGVQQALGKYIVCVYDVNQESALAKKFGVNVVPTMLIVDGNERVVKQTTGYMAVDQFTQWLAGPATPPSQVDPPRNNPPSQPQPPRKLFPRHPGSPGQGPVGPGCGPG